MISAAEGNKEINKSDKTIPTYQVYQPELLTQFQSEALYIVGLSQLSATSAKQKTTRYAGGRQ